MNDNNRPNVRIGRWSIVLPLAFVGAAATAQTLGAAEEIRAALKQELAPLKLSIREQARAVAADLASDVVVELADALTLSAPRPRLAHSKEKKPSGKDAS
jgi:hypothetical protein